MSNFRTLVMTSLIATLPLTILQAEDRVNVDAEIQVSSDLENLETLGDYQIDGEMSLELNLPFAIGANVDARLNKTLKELADEEIDADFFWETIEGLSLERKLGITVEVGKIKNIGFGADMSGVGETITPRYLDSMLVKNQVDLRGETGIKLNLGDIEDLTADQRKCLKVLGKILSGVTVTLFDPDSKDKPSFDSFKNLEAFAVQKIGEVMGLSYQLSYVDASTDEMEDKRMSVSAQYCINDRICLGAEHQDLSNSDASDWDNQQRVNVMAAINDRHAVGAEYERSQAKEDADADDAQTFSVVYEHQLGRNWSVAAKVGYDIESEDVKAQGLIRKRF